ncbi:MAG: DUF4139 domain-containing protein [Gemmataceae bacterium]
MRKWLFLAGTLLPFTIVIMACQPLVFGTVPGQNQQDAKAKTEKPAQSKIVAVTVYPNSALVSREVVVPAGQGTTEVVVSPLPPQVVDSSLYSEGTNGVRVLSTRFRTRQVKESSRKDVRKLQEDYQKLQTISQELQAQAKSIEANLQMISKLENFTSVTSVNATEKATLKSDQVIELAKYVMEQRIEKTKEKVALELKSQQNQEQMNFIQRKLNEVSVSTTRQERDAVILVDRPDGKGGKIRLNYLVSSVSWRPMYKFREVKGKELVEVDYLASLQQHSGEDWGTVELTLSTAQPMLNAAPPDLQKLEISVIARSSVPPGTPGFQAAGGVPTDDAFVPQMQKKALEDAKRLRLEAERYARQKDLKNNRMAVNSAAAREQYQELMQTNRDIERGTWSKLKQQEGVFAEGPSVTYRLPTSLTVPSRKDDQVIEVAKLKLTPSVYYKTIPVLSRNVYRLANVKNKTDYILLPGEATMYQGTDFVGHMRLPLVAIGEQFTVGFGVDPQLQVKRKMLAKTRVTQGGNQVITYDYQIGIESYKKEPVQLQVWDRLPHTSNSELAGVTIIKTDPELSTDPEYVREQKPNNLLRWDLKVPAMVNGEEALKINYSFRLELARDKIISRLDAK